MADNGWLMAYGLWRMADGLARSGLPDQSMTFDLRPSTLRAAPQGEAFRPSTFDLRLSTLRAAPQGEACNLSTFNLKL
ncbi:MAG: hypothetical protein KKC71_02905 [Chloroflexi bacterium]|nr:hypothetical protein [Chloroflexota bacterium]